MNDLICKKNEGINLAIMATTIHFIINYEPLKILKVYQGTCFGYVIFKTCWYAIYNDKVFVKFQYVNVKDAIDGLLKTLSGPENQGNLEVGLRHNKRCPCTPNDFTRF